MKNNNYLLLGAGLGLLAGYYINSNTGRQKRTEVADYLTTKQEKIKESGSSLIQDATQYISNLKNKGNAYLAEMRSEEVKQEDIENYIESKVEEFKAKLRNEISSINSKNGHKVTA